MLSLPKSSQDILNLIKIISGEAGPVQEFRSNAGDSINLYILTKRYNIVGCHAYWIICLLEKFVSEDPFECLAVACERTPTDMWLARLAIKGFANITRSTYDSPRTSVQFRHLHPDNRSQSVSNAGWIGTHRHTSPWLFRIRVHLTTWYPALRLLRCCLGSSRWLVGQNVGFSIPELELYHVRIETRKVASLIKLSFKLRDVVSTDA